jgi:hypothetical protein
VALPDHVVTQRLELGSIDDRQRNWVEILYASQKIERLSAAFPKASRSKNIKSQ